MNFVKSNKTFLVGVGLTLISVFISSKVFMKSVHPDIRKVSQLRTLIEKSYPNSLQSLETLKIEKRILTEYDNEGQAA